MVNLLRLCLDNVTRISFRVGTFEGRSIAFFFVYEALNIGP